MPPLSSPQKTALVAAVAGAVAGVTALTWSFIQLKRHRDASESVGIPPERWSTSQVAAWLHENGVSKASAALCHRFNVTGEALLQVTERDLYRMGVPLRDARVILAAVEDLKETPVVVARASLAPTPRQPSLASASSHSPVVPTAPVTTASPGERFEAAWNALVRTCVLPYAGASPAEQQQRVVVYTSALLECFKTLSSREQATALALVAAAEDSAAPTSVTSAASSSSPLANTLASTASPETAAAANALHEVEQKLQPLHAMVDSFLDFLQSPELAAVSAEDFEELGNRVAGQVKRVVRICEQLPLKIGGPLLRKCEKVFAELTRLQRAAVVSATSQQESRSRVMEALGEVIAGVKDPAIRELPPAQRVTALSALVEKAESVEMLASGGVADVPRDEQALQLVQPLLRFLREAVQSSAEIAAKTDGEAAPEDHNEKGEGGEGAKVRQMTNGDIPIIVDTIRKIQETLQSPEFQHTPAEVRAQLCAVLAQRISTLEEHVESLPTPTRRAGRELLQNTMSMLTAVGNAAAASAGGADEPDVAKGEREEAEEEGATDVPAASSVGIERCVAQLEKIFEFLSSEALEHAPADERKKMADELLQQVDKIRAEIKGDPVETSIVRELIEPLYDLLKSMAMTQAPSQQFLDLTSPLRDVQELLSSAVFKQLPHKEKMRIARGIVPQLQQLTVTFASLPASERVAAEELVRPLSKELLHIVREQPKTEVTVQDVLNRLQGVMRTIQGAEFTTMTPAGRSAWAANAVAELQRLNDECVSLGTEGAALRSIVLRLKKQLRSLFTADGHDEGEATAPPQKDPLSIWETVRGMQAELVQAETDGTFSSPARLQQMLSVLGEASEVADMTDTQESLLQDFSEELRKHIEAATTASDNSEDVADAEAAGDALDSLRVSLQTLLEVAQEDGGASGVELASIAAKTEELVGMADKAGVKWRDDGRCNHAVRSILKVLQQASGAGEQGMRDAGASAATAAATTPSKVEEVLRSAINALADAPPTSKNDFAPFMRVLQLAQPAAEQMTNRELVLLKTLQESVIEAMRRLPETPHPIGGAVNDGGAVPEPEEKKEEEEGDGKDDVDAALDALLDMSFKLRDGSYTSAQLDEFETIQHDLEDLLTRAGVDATEAMASVQEQIRLQRKMRRHAQGNGADNSSDDDEEEGEDDAASPVDVAAAEETAQVRESMNAFNEDDDDAASDGLAVAPAVPAQQIEEDEVSEGGEGEQEVAKR